MALYYYEGINQNGIRSSGKIESVSQQQVTEYIQDLGFVPIKIKKVNIFTKDIQDISFTPKKITYKELSFLSRKLSFIFTSGLPIHEGIQLIMNQTKDKENKKMLLNIADNVLKGESLYESFKKQEIYPNLFLNMLRVGEMSGNVASIMQKMAEYYEKQNKTKEEIINALLYPMLVTLLMTFVIIMALTFVVPNYASIFQQENIAMPLATAMLIQISQFLTTQYGWILLFFIVLYVAVARYLKTFRGKYKRDLLLLRLPIIKNGVTKLISYRFCLVLGILQEAGIHILESLEITKGVIDNSVVEQALESTIFQVRQGNDLSQSLSEAPFFDQTMLSLLRLGEETGFFTATMASCSQQLEFELDLGTKKIAKLVEPIITIVLGIILGFITLAIVLPTFSIASNMM